MEAAAEERRLAIERAGIHQGVPTITVVWDGVGLRSQIAIHTMP